jgi:DNA-binding response OmpR family regulator
MVAQGTILLVDDEEAIRKILSIKLRVSGYDVITAADGKKALQIVGTKKPDLVLLDLVLPRLSGFQVLEKLRNRVGMPIIAFSASPETAQKAIKLGADTFVAKPFDINDLVKTIGKFLNHKK